MKTTTSEEQQVALYIAKKCRQFLTNITRYDRDHTGQYRWGYQWHRHFIRMSGVEEYQLFDRMGIPSSPDDELFRLTINGVFIGTVTIWLPYAYPTPFMIIDFAEDMQYRPEVMLRFAQYAGMDTKSFDRSFLEVHHEAFVPADVLVY
jgi:hypothetical protein